MNVKQQVESALLEDVGAGDITTQLLKPVFGSAKVIAKSQLLLCGVGYFVEAMSQIDADIEIVWLYQEGDWVAANQVVAKLSGCVASILIAERVALNFLQLLSGIATKTKNYVDLVSKYNVKLYDTRKTLPGMRAMQKYAVTIGGGYNQRFGLYDAYLIKENHIAALGSITNCVQAAREQNKSATLQVEVENLSQLEEALDLNVTLILLDNFKVEQVEQAVVINAGKAELEVSGNIDVENLITFAATGVDRISIGDLTKNVQVVDLSLLLD